MLEWKPSVWTGPTLELQPFGCLPIDLDVTACAPVNCSMAMNAWKRRRIGTVSDILSGRYYPETDGYDTCKAMSELCDTSISMVIDFADVGISSDPLLGVHIIFVN